MNRMLRNAMLVGGLVLVASVAQAQDVAKARTFVDTVANQVIAIVQDKNASMAIKQQKIEALFDNKVDINYVAKFVLGKHWREATPEQQTAYMAAYKPFIMKNYAGKLTKYSGQTYSLKAPREDGELAVVTMEIIDPSSTSILVDYRLREEGAGAYKIVDISVEGVSLLTTQRSEFDAIVNNKGVDGLIEALKKQVAAKS